MSFSPEYLLFLALIGLIPAGIARRKGHSFVAYWLFGVAFFVIAVPVALLVKPNPDRFVPCPHCRTTIARAASVCPQCHRDVVPVDAR